MIRPGPIIITEAAKINRSIAFTETISRQSPTGYPEIYYNNTYGDFFNLDEGVENQPFYAQIVAGPVGTYYSWEEIDMVDGSPVYHEGLRSGTDTLSPAHPKDPAHVAIAGDIVLMQFDQDQDVVGPVYSFIPASSTGGGGSFILTVRESDLSPSLVSISTITFDQSVGLNVTAGAAGEAVISWGMTVREVDLNPIYTDINTIETENLTLTNPSLGVARITNPGLTVRESDLSPSLTDRFTLTINQATGLSVSAGGAGEAIITMNLTVREVDLAPSLTQISTISFDQTVGLNVTAGAAGEAVISWGMTVREVDLNPIYTDINTIEVNQADGLSVTNPSAGVARINFTAPATSEKCDCCNLRITGDSSSSIPDTNPGTAVDTLYLHRHDGSYVSLYDGTMWGNHEIADPALAISITDNGQAGGTAVAADTRFYLYIYDNSGTIAAECVTTAPVELDGRLVKTGDNTKRLVFEGSTGSTAGEMEFSEQRWMGANYCNPLKRCVCVSNFAIHSITTADGLDFWDSAVATADDSKAEWYDLGRHYAVVHLNGRLKSDSHQSGDLTMLGVGVNTETLISVDPPLATDGDYLFSAGVSYCLGASSITVGMNYVQVMEETENSVDGGTLEEFSMYVEFLA